MGKFTDNAKKTVTGCEIMQGREKISTEDIIAKWPQGITLMGFDILTGKEGQYPVFSFAEDSEHYYFGGKILSDIVFGWLDDYEGDKARCNADLKADGGLKVKLEKAKGKNGRAYTNVVVLD